MKVSIMMGVSGSGKSTKAAELGGKVFSADDFFVKDGKYCFNPASLSEAHGECLRGFVEALQGGVEHIIVDNTNTSTTELAPYIALSQAYGAEVEVLVVKTEPLKAFARNQHGVPQFAVERQHRQLQATLDNFPPWWPQPKEV